MRSRKGLAESVTAWLLVAGLLTAGFLLVLFRAPLLAAAGLTRDGAANTVDPAIFEPPPTAEVAAAGIGLIGQVAIPEEGPLPNRANLEARLNALDVSKLLDAEDNQVLPAYAVIDIATGELVGARSADAALIPASNTKLLTAVAVMNHFQGDETFATRVLQPAPGQIVIVGGGDPMLTSEPAAEGSYPQTASTRELANQTAKALKAQGETTVELSYDASLFAESWGPTWSAGYAADVTALTALVVDESRSETRPSAPAAAAAAIFAAQLAEAGITVTGEIAEAAASGEELARVESPPIHVLLEMAMLRSNNFYTEALGFQLALAVGQPATFAGSVTAIAAELSELGLWREGMNLADASGLSRENRISASTLADAVRLMATNQRLAVILDGMPTAGVTGTLAARFTDDISSPARGVAQGKTGTLDFVTTLAGTTRTADGRQLAFALLVNGPTDSWSARLWTDQATGTITSCGC